MKDICGNALVIREININLVRKSLKTRKNATKQEIARDTGLSIVTVGTVLQYLVSQHEVLESELSPSSGGRPAQKYRYNDDFAYALIVFPYEKDEKIHIQSIIVNLAGHTIQTSNVEVDAIDIKTFEQVIDPLYSTYPCIQSIGFGHPGVEESGKIIISDYKRLIGTDFTSHFRSRYHVSVMIENDVNAAVLGYASQRRLPSDSILVYLYFPDQHPPGAGILINDDLLKGTRSFAGEINMLPLGIVWDEALYSSFDAFCQAAAKLIIAMCAILNPDRIVLNGNFINERHIAAITGICALTLPHSIIPTLLLSDSFVSDYQNGLIAQTLKQLEPDIRITNK